MGDHNPILIDPDNILMNRRRFLIATGIGAVGLTVFPLTSAEASPVLGAVQKFADSIGAKVIADNISKYIEQSDTPKHTVKEVKKANKLLAADRVGQFSDFSQSKVYVIVTERTYFFYPVRSTDGFNASVAFFDTKRSQGTQRIALIQGPTLIGIAELGSRLAGEKSTEVAKRVLLPRAGAQMGYGTFKAGYDKHDMYHSDEGKVSARYTTNGDGKGIVAVEVRNHKKVLLAGGEYELTYRAE